jgi:hypothetical protein
VSLGYFGDGGQSYISLNLELACRTEITDTLSLMTGGGIHFLRNSYTGGSNLEIGPGVSGRVHYDGGWPVEPIGELSASYHYDKVIPSLSVGAAYRFGR